MLALVFDGEAVLRADYPEPQPGGDEALVAVRTAGVCSTDLEVMKGYMGFSGVMGHEFVGSVLEGPRRLKGKRVVAEINCVCGRCDLCKAGLSNHCRDRTVLGIDGRDGVFAEYVAIPVENLYEVPSGVSDEEAVFVEPLAAAFQLVRQIRFDRSGRAVVLGDGRLGQLVARVLKPLVGQLLLVGKHAVKLEAAEKQGIQTAMLGEFIPRGQADVVVDATGSASGLELAMRTVRPRGTIALKSTFAGEEKLNLSVLVVNEITVVGSRCGPFPDALRALEKHRINVSALISKRFPLTEAVKALQTARKVDNIKVLIDVT
ncbi:MAG: alcohol dehydrogenase catalytic domain-containing protein [Phycisphaerae bacterium]|nr:alcohol dehydrogenase catalytic domain-containing protein [Phycisphaerae bacterium]